MPLAKALFQDLVPFFRASKKGTKESAQPKTN